jgi:hypothetical protein
MSYFQNSKGKYENRKILGFARNKMRKIDIFEMFEFLLLFFNYFEKFICFLNFWEFFLILSFKINNWIMHKDYLKFIVAYYYLITVAYFWNYMELKK